MSSLEDLMRRNVLQVLFKAARLANEESIRRVRAAAGDERIRVAHTALFPHVTFDGIRLTELADRLGVTKQAVQQLVDELEEIGIFERISDPADGRAKLIRWSEAGKSAIENGLGVLQGLADELGDLVGADELQRTHQVLLAIVAHLEAREG